MRARGALAAAVALALFAGPAEAAGSSRVAAVQVAMRALGHYGSTIDGVAGPGTRRAVAAFQRRRGLMVDGIAGRQTLRALGRRGRPGLGRRAIRVGAAGFDVAALQFRLAWRGFPSGPIDGGYGARTAAAVRRFQRWAGLGADGVAGRATIRALGGPIRRSPLSLSRPVTGPISDRFRPRGNRFHTGIDFPVPYGRTVRAARAGTVVGAGYDPGGYGNVVHIAHGYGVTTFYAHLSRITVRRGEGVAAGERVGTVGSTGFSSGPHLHFEVRLRGAMLNPMSGLR